MKQIRSKLINTKQRRLGLLAGLFLRPASDPKPSSQQLHQKDFKSNTRKIGVRFSSRLRDSFRFRWLRLK